MTSDQMPIGHIVRFGPFLTLKEQLEEGVYLTIFSPTDGSRIGWVDPISRGAAVEWDWSPSDLASFKEALESVGCSTRAWERGADGEMVAAKGELQ